MLCITSKPEIKYKFLTVHGKPYPLSVGRACAAGMNTCEEGEDWEPVRGENMNCDLWRSAGMWVGINTGSPCNSLACTQQSLCETFRNSSFLLLKHYQEIQQIVPCNIA